MDKVNNTPGRFVNHFERVQKTFSGVKRNEMVETSSGIKKAFIRKPSCWGIP